MFLVQAAVHQRTELQSDFVRLELPCSLCTCACVYAACQNAARGSNGHAHLPTLRNRVVLAIPVQLGTDPKRTLTRQST
jgi:hypothetical protein